MSSGRDERRLDVDLRELGLPVLTQILVAEAARDLEVAVEAGDHEQLLIELRRLRQRVELARMHAARHEIVARALGRGLREDRRLDLEEAPLAEIPPRHLHQPVAQHDVVPAAPGVAGRESGGEVEAPRRRDSRCARARRESPAASPARRLSAPSREPRRRRWRAPDCASLQDARRLRPRRARPSRVRALPRRRRRRPGSISDRTRPARCPPSRAGRRTRVRRGRGSRCTQPPSRTCCPTCADVRSAPHRWVRWVVARWSEVINVGVGSPGCCDRAKLTEMREGQPTGRQQVASYRRTAGHESGRCRTGSRFCFKEWFIPVCKCIENRAHGDRDSLDLLRCTPITLSICPASSSRR